jgi:NAD(P)-dependent dehydrogenase (short-subunit alcohol dehydrogenase family)
MRQMTFMSEHSGPMAGMRALITGGAQGIGLATARRFRDDGARVALLDLHQATEPDLISITADVSRADEVRCAVEDAVQRLGGLDVLVNNAAIGAVGGVEDNDDNQWQRVLDINVVGTVRVTRAALLALRGSTQASIVNVCSAAASCGLPQRVLYSASKGAVAAMTLALAADLLSEGIRVNAVSPGTADTPWVQRLLANSSEPGAERAALEARQPHRRLVRAEEVAAAIAYLASPLAGSTTGTVLTVDGGLTSLRPRPANAAPVHS